jgi:hypothetical protein
LVRASEINRCLLLTEAVPCRAVAEWVDTGMALAAKAATILGVITPLLSMWRRRSKRGSGFLSKLVQGFILARSVARIWSAIRARG